MHLPSRKFRWTAAATVAAAAATATGLTLASYGGGSVATAASGQSHGSPRPAAGQANLAPNSANVSGPAAAPAPAAGSPATGSATGADPVLQTLTYSYPAGSDGQLDHPAGVSASGGTVYVSNTDEGVVSTLADGDTTVIAGSLEGFGEHGDGQQATSATLYQPGGTATDGHGDVFIADSGDNVVREITPDGVIHRFAGTGAAGSALGNGKADGARLNHPESVAADAKGDVFIADAFNNRVLEVTPGSAAGDGAAGDGAAGDGTIRVVAGNGRPGYAGDGGPAAGAELSQPTGVALDAQGDLYIADASNNVIRRIDARTGRIATVAGDYAADKADDGLGGFSGDGGPATKARLNDPQGVAVDGAGDLFIADTFNNAVREVTPAGTITTVAGYLNSAGTLPAPGGETSGVAPTSSHLYDPYAVAVDLSTGALYIADTHNSKIAEVLNVAKGDAHA